MPHCIVLTPTLTTAGSVVSIRDDAFARAIFSRTAALSSAGLDGRFAAAATATESARDASLVVRASEAQATIESDTITARIGAAREFVSIGRIDFTGVLRVLVRAMFIVWFVLCGSGNFFKLAPVSISDDRSPRMFEPGGVAWRDDCDGAGERVIHRRVFNHA
jgi:hypothetical protein